MQELLNKLLTIAKEGTTVKDVEAIVREGLPGLQDAVLEGLTKDDVANLSESHPAFKAARDSANSKAIQTWRENHLNTEIEKAVAQRTPLTSVEDIKRRLDAESDPTQRAILEGKLEAAQARAEMAEFKKEQEQAVRQARRDSLRASASKLAAGKLPEGHEALLDRLVGEDEESTTAAVSELLKLTETIKGGTFEDLTRKYGIRPGNGADDDQKSFQYTRSALRDAETRKEYMDRRRKGEPVAIVDDTEG